MKVLLTGASGFVGSNLLTYLSGEFGHQNIMLLSSKLHPKYKSLVYSDFNFCLFHNEKALEEIEVIIHVGAFTPKNASEANISTKCNSNISYTQALLELPLPKLKKIIFISTIDVYESAEVISEKTPTIPQSLYGWSKLYCEQLVVNFAREREITAQVLRLGHIYGPGEEQYQKLIPHSIKNALSFSQLELWGSGEELRSFIYIDDVIKAIAQAEKLDEYAGPINIVSTNSISVKLLLEKLCLLLDQDIKILKRESKHTPRDYRFDNQLLVNKLLTRETNLDDGLRNEITYMKNKL